jgi:phosphoglycolate phosphatase-like HAD superfamily hydrolase
MSDREVLRRLSGAGVDLGAVTEAQREVLEALSDQEADVLVDVLRRLEEAGPDVTAHSAGASGGAFW